MESSLFLSEKGNQKARCGKLRLLDEVSVTRDFDWAWTEAHLGRATGYGERYSGGVHRAIAGLQIRHLLEVGRVSAWRCGLRASMARGDVAGL